eukprot:g71563.t1
MPNLVPDATDFGVCRVCGAQAKEGERVYLQPDQATGTGHYCEPCCIRALERGEHLWAGAPSDTAEWTNSFTGTLNSTEFSQSFANTDHYTHAASATVKAFATADNQDSDSRKIRVGGFIVESLSTNTDRGILFKRDINGISSESDPVSLWDWRAKWEKRWAVAGEADTMIKPTEA